MTEPEPAVEPHHPAAAYGVAILALAATIWLALSLAATASLIERLALPLPFALLTALAALGAGGAWRALRNTSTDRSLVYSLAADLIVGLPLFGSIVFLIGTITTTPAAMAAVLFTFASLGVVNVVRTAQQIAARARDTPASASLMAIFVAFAGVTLVHVFAVALLPAFSLDEVAYHLTVVKSWVLEGRVVELPLLSHSYFPFGSEAAHLPLISLLGNRGAIASHLVSLLVALAVIVTAFHFVRRRAGVNAGLLAAIALMATPAMAVTAGWTWNDWPLLGAVILLLDALDRDELDTSSIALAVAAGLLTKYTFVAPALALIAARVISARKLESPLIRGLAAGGAIGSIFFLRNVLMTGNPFAPMFGALAPKVSHFRSGEGVLGSLRSYIFDPGIADESLGVTLLVLAVAGLSQMRVGNRRARLSLVASWISLIALALTMPSSRILVPSLVVAALLGATLIDMSRRRPAVALAVPLLFAAAIQLSIAIFYFDTLGSFAVFAGHSTEEQYLERLPFFQESAWADAQLPDDSRTLVVGLNSLFWFDHRVRGGGNFDGPRMSAYLERGSASDLRERVRRDGITHIAIFDRGLMIRDALHRERATDLSPTAIVNLRALVNQFASPVREEGNRHLFSLR